MFISDEMLRWRWFSRLLTPPIQCRISMVDQVVSVIRGTDSKISFVYLKCGKHHPRNPNADEVWNDSSWHTLRRIVTKDKNTTAAKVTDEINLLLTNLVSTKRIRRELHKEGISIQASIQKLFIGNDNARNWRKSCLRLKQWRTVI